MALLPANARSLHSRRDPPHAGVACIWSLTDIVSLLFFVSILLSKRIVFVNFAPIIIKITTEMWEKENYTLVLFCLHY